MSTPAPAAPAPSIWAKIAKFVPNLVAAHPKTASIVIAVLVVAVILK